MKINMPVKRPKALIDLTRHSYRNYSGKITPLGKAVAEIKGKNIPKKYDVLGRTSQIPRAIKTLELIQKGARTNGVNRIKTKNPIEKALSEEVYLINKNKLAVQVKDYNLLLKQWLDGKLPKGAIKSPDFVFKNIFQKVILPEIRLVEIYRKGKPIYFPDITHDLIVALLFEKLTGIKYYSKFKNYPQPLEGTKLLIYPKKRNIKNDKTKVILIFRKEKYDVTNRIEEMRRTMKK